MVNVEKAAERASAVAMIVSAPMGLAVSGQCRANRPGPECRDDRQCNQASAASMAVAFETVVVATQVSAETTTTVVMDNCVTIEAAARPTTTTNPARGAALPSIGLGRSVCVDG